MDYSYIFGGIGGLVGFAFFLCFIYERFQRRRLQIFSRSQAWFLYKKANRLLTTIQSADELYHKMDKNTLESEIVKRLAKSEAFALDVLDETIRHIQLFDPKFNSKTIQQWEEENKILRGDKDLFELKEDKNLLKKIAKDSMKESASNFSESLSIQSHLNDRDKDTQKLEQPLNKKKAESVKFNTDLLL